MMHLAAVFIYKIAVVNRHSPDTRHLYSIDSPIAVLALSVASLAIWGHQTFASK